MAIALKDLPKPIRKLAEKRAKQKPVEITSSGFFFNETKEGQEFWRQIFKGNFKPFYKMYPKKDKKKKESIEELILKANYKYSFGNTKFCNPEKKFVAHDYREGHDIEKAKEIFKDLLPNFYAPTLRKVIKKAIKFSEK